MFARLKPYLQACVEQRSAEMPDLPQILENLQMELDEYL